MCIYTHHNILYSRTCTHLARMRNDLARTYHHFARICQDCARIAPFPRPLCTHARTSVHHATHFLLCPSALGKDGMLEWVCAIPALGKVNLLLEWEVTNNPETRIVGL